MENETRNRDQKYVTFVPYKISVQTFQGLNLTKTIHKSYRIPVQILQDSSPDVSGNTYFKRGQWANIAPTQLPNCPYPPSKLPLLCQQGEILMFVI